MPAARSVTSAFGLLGVLALSFTMIGVEVQPAAAQPAPVKPGTGVFPLTPVWAVTLDTAPALAPAYDATRAYLVLKPDPDRQDSKPRLVAIALSNGSTAWTREIDAADAIVTGSERVLTCAGPQVRAFATADGAPQWQSSLGAPLSAPLLVARDVVVAVTQASEVLALRANDGAKIWQAHLPSPAAGQPAASGDALYLPLTDNRVLRMRLDSGALVWDQKILSQPTTILALADRVFVGTARNWFYTLQPKDGRVLWRFPIGGAVVGQPAADAAHVYFLTLDNLLRALDRVGGPLTWRQMLVRRERFGPLLADGLLFVSGASQSVQAFDGATGTAAGSFDAPKDLKLPVHILGGLIETDFLVVAVTGEGDVMAMRPQSLQPEPFSVSGRVLLMTGFPVWKY